MSGPNDACSLLGESCWDYSGNEAFSLVQALSRRFSLLSSPTSSDYSAVYTREKTKSKRIVAKKSKTFRFLVIFLQTGYYDKFWGRTIAKEIFSFSEMRVN